jgi:glycosyltransferase involved in cell wall biosynthesis
MLSQRGILQPKVFYTWGESVMEKKYDPGFGKVVEWDIPLLKGYAYTFVNNVAKVPGSKHYKGIDNPTLIKEIENWGADAVLIYGWAFKSHFKAMRHFKGRIPVLFRGDSIPLRKGNPLKLFLRKYYLRYVYSFIDYALYVGTWNKQYFLNNQVSSNKLFYAPHATDTERFSINEQNVHRALELRKQLGIGHSELVFLFAAKFEHVKAPVELVQSFLQLKNNHCHLVMVGNGPLEIEVREAANGNSKIHFLPFQNQSMMPIVYQLGDVFILPSQEPETWGLSVNEAMAASKAIIVSNSCGCAPDLIQDDLNGFVFNSGSFSELTDYMQRMADNPEKVKKMGIVSYEIIHSFNFKTICSTIEKLIQ